VDRSLDRLDRGFEIHDDAAPDPLRVSEPDADDVEPPVLGGLSDDGGDLRRADVEPDQVPFLARHWLPLQFFAPRREFAEGATPAVTYLPNRRSTYSGSGTVSRTRSARPR